MKGRPFQHDHPHDPDKIGQRLRRLRSNRENKFNICFLNTVKNIFLKLFT